MGQFKLPFVMCRLHFLFILSRALLFQGITCSNEEIYFNLFSLDNLPNNHYL